jgi:hypothetical protein
LTFPALPKNAASAAIDAPRPSILHDEIMKRMNARIARHKMQKRANSKE